MAEPKRVEMTRQPGGWRAAHPKAVIVARPTMWGNPWRLGEPGTFWLPNWPVRIDHVDARIDAEDAVTLFRHLIDHGPDPVRRVLPQTLNCQGERQARDMLRSHAARILRHLPDLRGRDLACWCSLDCPCHADVLLEMSNA